MPRATILTPALLALVAGSALGAPPRVILSEIPGDPTAVCPGTGGIEFTAFLDLHASYDGNWWVFKGFINDTENDVVVYGHGTDGSTATLAAWEAHPTMLGDGTSHNFLDSDCGINDSGEYCYGSRLDGATTTTDEITLASDGLGGEFAAFRESQPAAGLSDSGTVGDEAFGNTLNSCSRQNDGTVNVHADSIQNTASAFQSALYTGSVPVAQEGTMGASGQTYGGFASLGGDLFGTSADGSHWIVEADIDPSALATVEAVVVDGFVEVQDADSLGEGIVDNVFGVRMSGNGSWMARGDYTDDNDWVIIGPSALRSSSLLVQSGDPITTGNAELWGASIGGINLNDNGDYILSGNTNNTDTNIDNVIVLNSSTVIAREGDAVDLDGNGMADDDAEIAGFSPNDLALNPDGDVIAFVTLRKTSDASSLGDAFIVIDVPGGPCNAADLDGNGVLNLDDVNLFAAAFAGGDLLADLDNNGVLNLDDVNLFAMAFVAGCP
ncbi:MAG: GC-type dockerin domain-anchored protein [Phycisphaerales bacterium]